MEGSKVKILRKKRGWTQQYLADIIGCSRGHLILLENKDQNSSLRLAKKLAYALGVKVEEL